MRSWSASKPLSIAIASLDQHRDTCRLESDLCRVDRRYLIKHGEVRLVAGYELVHTMLEQSRDEQRIRDALSP